jgi:hypothetical protein
MGTNPNAQSSAGSAVLGVLMLDTRFPRWPGDIGCDRGLVGPVLRRVVAGALPRRVVVDADALRASGLADAFEAAALDLAAAGAGIVTTSCGFLALLQQRLQALLPVPLVSSSLLQLPALLDREPRVGVLTIDADALGRAHLRAAGVPDHRRADVVIEGVDRAGEFARAILGNREALDRAAAERDIVAAARALAAREPGLRTVVLECTNLPPFAAAIERATGWRLRWLRHDPRLEPFFDPEEVRAA